MSAAGIMDYVQALFSFFISPLLGVVLVGMFWKRATKEGGFWGLLMGTVTSIGLWGWVKADPSALRFVAISPNARDMAENMYRALWSVIVAILVNVIVSLATKPKTLAELNGLVYGATTLPDEEPVPFYKNEYFWLVIAIIGSSPSTLFSGKEVVCIPGIFQSGFSSAFCSPFTER